MKSYIIYENLTHPSKAFDSIYYKIENLYHYNIIDKIGNGAFG